MTREELLARNSVRVTAPLDAADWGDGFSALQLSARERLDVELSCEAYKEGKDSLHNIAVYLRVGVIGPDGKPFFQPGDEEAIKDMPAGVVTRAFNVMSSLNAMRADDIPAAKKN